MQDEQHYRDNLQAIKMAALALLDRINGTDTVDVQRALEKYELLVDEFYKISEYLAPHQYNAAKKDFVYFIRLLELAILYSETGEQGA